MGSRQTAGVGSLRALGILVRVQISASMSALSIKRGVVSGVGQGLAYLVYVVLGVFLSLSIGATLLFIDPSLIPGMALVLASLIAAVLTFRSASGSFFGFKDYDQVMSLPVPTWVVVLSRVGALFAVQVVVSAVLMLPMYVLSAFAGGIGAAQAITGALSILLAGALPVSLVIFLSLGIAVVAARTRNFNAAYLLLSILLFTAMLVGSFAVQDLGPAEVEAVHAFFANAVELYPLAAWSAAAWAGNLAYLLPFCLVSFGAFAACIAVLSACFMRINAAVTARGRGRVVDMDASVRKRSGIMPALIKKELRCIMGTPIYATNSIGGEILVVILVAMLAVMGKEGAMSAAVDYMQLGHGAAMSAVQLSDVVLPWAFCSA